MIARSRPPTSAAGVARPDRPGDDRGGGRADAELDGLLDRWRLAGCLERIPADEAEDLRMRFYEGLSQSEIAERTGTPLGTVKTRMVRGLARLREMIGEEEGTP